MFIQKKHKFPWFHKAECHSTANEYSVSAVTPPQTLGALKYLFYAECFPWPDSEEAWGYLIKIHQDDNHLDTAFRALAIS